MTIRDDVVYTLTKYNSDSRIWEYVESSGDLKKIVETMLMNSGNCYDYKVFVTDFDNDGIDFLEWRKQNV